jgi:hypothetical protein
MQNDLPISCSCGSLRGVARGVSPTRGNRVVCYCDDCQSFAHALERADEILDEHGGTDIFQISPARVEITQGREHLACLRLRRGGLLRWYADCCRTPIGNTPPLFQLPFVGLIHSGNAPPDGLSRDQVMGPIRAGVHGRFAKGDRSKLDAHDRAPLSQLFRFGPLLLMARLRGAQRHSPFFDAATGKPSVRPRVLTEDELRKVEAARDAV